METFELYLSPLDARRFKAIVTKSPVGEGETETLLPFFEDENDWRTTVIKTLEATAFKPENFPKAFEQELMVKSGILHKDKSAFHLNYLANIGQALYQALFPSGSRLEKALLAAERVTESDNTLLHIQLKFEADVVQRSRLADYPWELLHDGENFLLHRHVTISRYIAHKTVPPNLSAVEKVNVLLVSSAAFDLDQRLKPLTKKEQQAIRKGLEKASEAGLICLAELEYATVNELRAYLTEHRGKDAPHILHFDGHGLFGKRCPNPQCRFIHQGIKVPRCHKCNTQLPDAQGYLVFENEEGEPDYVSAAELGNLLRQSSLGDGNNTSGGVALVVLSACRSAMAVAGDSVFNGTAQNLISHRVPAVVAMQYSVSVEAATKFAEQFYRSLGQKNSLAVAISKGREAMGTEGSQWYRPVLYLRWRDNEGGQLFAVPKPTPLGIPFQVQTLPEYFVDRPEYSQDLKTRLLTGSSSETKTLIISAIHGLASVGKSTLVAALTHDKEVQTHFSDGILWATLGQQPDVLKWLGGWVQALGDREFRAMSIEATSSHLRTLLYDKAVLLVVDDAWNTADVQAFKVGGPRCQMVVTTREASIADALGASIYNLNVMKPEQAMKLLIGKLKHLGREMQEAEGSLAADLAEAVGYLPLALELAAAQVASGIFWVDLLQDIKQEVARLKTFDRPGARENTDEVSLKRLSLTASLNLSVQRLREEEQEHFIWLGVLPEDVTITQKMTATLWEMDDERDAADELQYLRDKSLLLPGVPSANGKPTYRLHDLLHDLARNLLTAPITPKRRGDLPGLGFILAAAHAELLERYRKRTRDGLWHTLEDDGYIYTHLAYHLKEAKRNEELFALVDQPWIKAQLDLTGSYAASVADIEIALKAAAEEPIEVVAFSRSCLLESILHNATTEMPLSLIGAIASIGQVERALQWVSLHPDLHTRLYGFALIAEALIQAGDVESARPVLKKAVFMIAKLGETVQTGHLPTLTELNAVHALVRFPHADQWEGTTPEYVELARIPLDATITLIPLLAKADLLNMIAYIHHPFWGVYGSLIPRLAAEQFAADGETNLARAILDILQEPDISGFENAEDMMDIVYAARYREAVAWAALGEHQRAIKIIDAIPRGDYLSVGYHQIAVYAAKAGHFDLALRLIDNIDDSIELKEALLRLVSPLIAQPNSDYAQAIAKQLLACQEQADGIAALVAGGFIDQALAEIEKATSDTKRTQMRLSLAQTFLFVGKIDLAEQVTDQITEEICNEFGSQWIGIPFLPTESTQLEEQILIIYQLIGLLIDTNRWSVCVESLKTLSDTVQWTATVALAVLLASRGRMSEILALANWFESSHMRSVLIANAIVYLENIDEQAIVRVAVEQLLIDIEQMPPTDVTFLPLLRVIESLTDLGELSLASACAERLDEPYDQVYAQAEIALAYVRNGDLNTAKRLVAPFKATIQPIAGLATLSSVLCTAAIMLYRLGEKEEANQVLEFTEALQRKLPANADKFTAQIEFVGTLAEFGEVERAKSIAKTIGGRESTELLQPLFAKATSSDDVLDVDSDTVTEIALLADAQADALAYIAVVLAKQNRSGEAVEIAQNAATLATLASMMGLEGDSIKSAAKALVFAGASRDAVDLVGKDWFAITEVATAMVEAGEIETALLLIEDTLTNLKSPFSEGADTPQILFGDEVWEVLRDYYYARITILATAAEIAAAAGNMQKATHYADEANQEISHMNGTYTDRIQACTMLGKTFYQVGKQEESQELLRTIRLRAIKQLEEKDTLPPGMLSPLLDIALAMSRCGDTEYAQHTWLNEVALARFDNHQRVLLAIATGLECLADANKAEDVRGLTHLLIKLEQVWPLT